MLETKKKTEKLVKCDAICMEKVKCTKQIKTLTWIKIQQAMDVIGPQSLRRTVEAPVDGGEDEKRGRCWGMVGASPGQSRDEPPEV